MTNGVQPRETNEVYPAQDKPSDVALKDWKHSIYASCIHGTDGVRNIGIPIPIPSPITSPAAPQTFSSYLRLQSTAIRGILGHGLNKYSETALTTFTTSLSLCEGI